MDEDNAKEEAMFKYGIIAPVVGGFLNECSKEAFFRCAAEKEYSMPDGKIKKFRPATIKKWYLNYKKEGITALMHQERSDAGISRTLDDTACKRIHELREQFPKITGQKIFEKLLEEGTLAYGDSSVDSVYRYLRAQNMTPQGMTPEECLSFEFDHANDCWQADTVDGVYIDVGGESRLTYLISFLDDASRIHPHGEFFFSDNGLNVQKVLKKAIQKAGCPRMIFDDNGTPYRNRQINWICAQLGIVLIHSKPYKPRGKGKEERSHRTASQRFMDCTDFSGCHSLDDLNTLYWNYLDTEYHVKVHSTIGMTPRERYMQDYSRIKFLDPDVLEEAFLHSQHRKVNKAACVSLMKVQYEVPQKYIGETVHLRYNPEDMSEIYIYDEKQKKRLETVKPVNKYDNRKRKRRNNISYAGGSDDV